MNQLTNLALPTDADVDEKDVLGGSFILESGLYEYDIDMAYMVEASTGAVGVNMIFSKGEQKLKQSFWVKSGNVKGNKTTFTDARSGKERPLPGLSVMNAITFLTVGKTLDKLTTEEKVVKLYSYEAKEEVNTTVQVISVLLKQPIVLGVMKNEVDVTKKNDVTKQYDTTGATKFENEVSKVFQAGSNCTIAEVKAGEPAEFIAKWNDKNKDTIRNKVNHKGAISGSAGAPANAPPTKSLFAA